MSWLAVGSTLAAQNRKSKIKIPTKIQKDSNKKQDKVNSADSAIILLIF